MVYIEGGDHMGTIDSQLPRKDHLKKGRVISFADQITEIAKESNISYMEALETFKTLALIDDYDTKDEQIAGLAEILRK